jgi:hypothetical protein
MIKTLALAVSVTMLIAVSGQAFDRAMTTQTAQPNAHRYHGGPKSND